jgi:hypothetical protein
MLFNVLFLILFVVALGTCLVIAVRQPTKRRLALRNAAYIAVMGLVLGGIELAEGFPQVADRVWGPLFLCFILLAGLRYFARDLWAGIPWREAVAKNRGGLTVTASIAIVAGLNFCPRGIPLLIAWPLAMLAIFVMACALIWGDRRAKSMGQHGGG